MQPHPVADLAGDPEHRLADGGDRHRHHRQSGRLRREVGRHQGELVVLAPVIELFALLPAAPDRAQRLDIVAQPGCGRAPGDPEPALVVASDLAAEPQHEAPVRIRLQVPGLARHDRRAAREGDRDRRRQLDPLGREGGKGERREGVVRELGGHHRIEAGFLRSRREPPGLAPMPHRQHRENPHRLPPTAGIAFPLSTGENLFSASEERPLLLKKYRNPTT
jgi:hypothetical protein